MEILKNAVYVAAAAIMALVIVFCPEISAAVTVFFVMILSTYLGIDVYGMIKETKAMPDGEYKKIKPVRYVLCTAAYAVLSALCFYVHKAKDVSVSATLTILVSALFILIAILFGALEGNKVATWRGGKSGSSTGGVDE